MTPQEVLAEVEGLGCRLTLRPGGLRLTGSAEPNSGLLALIFDHWSALVKFLEVETKVLAAHEASLVASRLTTSSAHLLGLIHPSIRHLADTQAGAAHKEP